MSKENFFCYLSCDALLTFTMPNSQGQITSESKTMFTNLKNLYKFVDDTARQVREQFPTEVKCRPGCTDCCSAVFDVSYIEAAYLAHCCLELDDKIKKMIFSQAGQALKEWQQLFASPDHDPSTARIRCPLLNNEGLCSCYQARPVNCRTYGVPTIINNSGHVCGLSGFSKGKSYPTINLDPLQQSLYEFSLELGGRESGAGRWPVAAVLLSDQ
jgi:Fe-S-cluster containining protein